MDKLNQWLALLGNLGVIAGILFLALEIQQNTNMMQAQTRDAMTDKQMNLFHTIASDPYTSDILTRGNLGTSLQSELDDSEFVSYLMLVQSNLRMWENEYYQYQMGLFDEEEFEPRMESWRRVVDVSRGYISIWQDLKSEYSPEFRAAFDEVIQ